MAQSVLQSQRGSGWRGLLQRRRGCLAWMQRETWRQSSPCSGLISLSSSFYRNLFHSSFPATSSFFSLLLDMCGVIAILLLSLIS